MPVNSPFQITQPDYPGLKTCMMFPLLCVVIHLIGLNDIMKLQQLRYILEVYKNNLNVSETAEALFTSQPGISKQIRLLEEELGIQIFIRNGKRVVSVSEPGKAVLDIAQRIMRDVQSIKQIGSEFSKQDTGSLTIATTHTQARYSLPKVIAQYVKDFPDVRLSIKQGNPSELCDLILSGEADLAITAESLENYPELCKLPCYQWNRSVIVPDAHPLLELKRPIRLSDIAQYPLITYEFAFDTHSEIARAFQASNTTIPEVALATVDTDVIKTYVKLGLGIGLMASMAYIPEDDNGLKSIDCSHLFAPSTTHIALRQDTYLRGFIYQFIEAFAPDLTRARVDQMLYHPITEDFSI